MDQYIPPQALSIFRNESGNLCACIEGRGRWEKVTVRRAFPYSRPERYVQLADDEEEIGIIRDIRELDASSRAALEDNLGKRYFVPVIERIIKIEEIRRFTRWHVQTDMGMRQFEVLDRHSFRPLPDGGLIIVDVDANRFRIPSRHALDRRSRDMLDMHC